MIFGAPSGGPSNCTGSDNCPDTSNPGQENNVHPGTPEGDHCEDLDADTVFDADDNCPDTVKVAQSPMNAQRTPKLQARGARACERTSASTYTQQ